MAWISGVLDAVRAAPTASTTRSNGASWCASPASSVWRPCRSASAKRVPGSNRARSASVLTKNPISDAVSGRVRWATGVPTTRSDCPLQRASTACIGGSASA